jgi:UDP-N-acetylglucosamine diphosphorylase/glucosamine-1-phosphate N-acetyltransferase
MRVCLFEDRGVADLEPLTWTRPVFDLLCGQTSLAAKQCRAFGASAVGALVRPHLTDLCRLESPGLFVNDLGWLRAGPTVLINGRWLPSSLAVHDPSEPHLGMIDDQVAYAVLHPDHLAGCSSNTIDDCLESWKATLPSRPAGGRLFRFLWEIVDHNGEQLIQDWQSTPHRPLPASVSLAVVGPAELLRIDPTTRIDPLVVADTTRGPIVIDRGVIIDAFTRLEGPCYVGPGTHVFGAKIRAGTTLGPECRIGGEVEASIIQGYSNKYHDGFLGHAYVGAWVNLGAGTQASDLRNDYGPVTVTVDGRPVATGRTKVGCFLGDHTKTGLGALLNTGTNAGLFCNLLPGGLLPKYVPSFCSCWNGVLTDRTDLTRALETAATVLSRRGRAFTEVHAALYRTLYDQTAAERRRALRDAEIRRLRRTG